MLSTEHDFIDRPAVFADCCHFDESTTIICSIEQLCVGMAVIPSDNTNVVAAPIAGQRHVDHSHAF
jgi:hypothetical protein